MAREAILPETIDTQASDGTADQDATDRAWMTGKTIRQLFAVELASAPARRSSLKAEEAA